MVKHGAGPGRVHERINGLTGIARNTYTGGSSNPMYKAASILIIGSSESCKRIPDVNIGEAFKFWLSQIPVY